MKTTTYIMLMLAATILIPVLFYLTGSYACATFNIAYWYDGTRDTIAGFTGMLVLACWVGFTIWYFDLNKK